MKRIFSNGPQGDYVVNPFDKLAASSSNLFLAAPYFNYADPILKAARGGKLVHLLVGLNATTRPEALRKVHAVRGIALRYLTRRFHAKVYIFDNAVLLGSSNLTNGGLHANREAVICLDQPEDADVIEEVRAVFLELWNAGQVLTRETLDTFSEAYSNVRRQAPDLDSTIEKAVGKAEPPNINVDSREKSKERIFLEGLRREVYEQYRPAFHEVMEILEEHRFRRDDLIGLGTANETNRFLNYVRVVHVIGDEAWKAASLRSQEERRAKIMHFGREWVEAADNRVSEDYAAMLKSVTRIFATADSLTAATKDEVTEGLMSLHAFFEQFRFVEGGTKNLAPEFWKLNNHDVARVKSTLSHLLYGPGEFIQRLHDIVYDPSMKLSLFGRFSALELYGTLKPEECPPMNGRIAKALRYLGFNVKGS